LQRLARYRRVTMILRTPRAHGTETAMASFSVMALA
jgi:hypothetical protein